jgi:hypothetical protein
MLLCLVVIVTITCDHDNEHANEVMLQALDLYRN